LKLPVVSGVDTVAALSKIGFRVDKQSGSHILIRRIVSPHLRLSVPDHPELAKGTLRTLIRQAGLTVEEFTELLD
jgi:predicted RNA binding protein YcfA (HicA-like mRNA interferase family)